MRVFGEELMGCETTCTKETYYPECGKGVGEVECYSSGTWSGEAITMVDYNFRSRDFISWRRFIGSSCWRFSLLMLYLYPGIKRHGLRASTVDEGSFASIDCRWVKMPKCGKLSVRPRLAFRRNSRGFVSILGDFRCRSLWEGPRALAILINTHHKSVH